MADEDSMKTLTLPDTTLGALRRRLTREVGPSTAVRVLQDAGYETGQSLHPSLLDALEAHPSALAPEPFWNQFDRFWRHRGWGGLEHRDLHPAVGLLVSDDWVESAAEEGPGGSRPECAFTSGILAGLLGAIGDGPVAVLEIRCRGRGDDDCAFAFGADRTIHSLYGALLDGKELGQAVREL